MSDSDRKTYDLSELAFLVIDDNTHMISIIKTLLKGFGVRNIHEATDAADAFEEFRATHIDIILLDYALDTLDGIEFAQLVRTAKDSPNPYLPIIMLTAHTERHRVEEARDAGITEFLCKPICATDLYKRIIEVIEFPRSFVKAGGYFGPDRRRFPSDNYRGKERRKDIIAAEKNDIDFDNIGEEGAEEDASQTDIDALFA